MTHVNRSLSAAAAWLLFVHIGAAASFAADTDDVKPAKSKPAASSLDDELFKDLSDGAPDLKPQPAASKSASKPAPSERPPEKTTPTPESKPAGETKPETPSQPRRTASQPKLTDPLDRELLGDLGGDLGGAPDAKPSRKPDAGHGNGGAKPAVGDGEDSAAESDDPLVRLTRRVRDAERRLRRTDSGDETQELQRGIVDDLEKLIAQVEQQAQKKKSQSKGAPSGPGQKKPGPKKPGEQKPGNTPGDQPNPYPTDSDERLTAKKAERPTTGKLKEMLEKVWGNLPERERQDVMQSSFEDFPAKYQFGIEQYFKTLLQRKD